MKTDRRAQVHSRVRLAYKSIAEARSAWEHLQMNDPHRLVLAGLTNAVADLYNAVAAIAERSETTRHKGFTQPL